jgi:hypothetical protein
LINDGVDLWDIFFFGFHGLNRNGIEPTFLELDLWSPGAVIIPIITSNILNYIKKKRIQEKKTFYAYKKHLTQFLKLGSILF